MTKKILLTSFQTWLPHQDSNSSDDLLEIMATEECEFADLYFIRQLPVEISSASQQITTAIELIKPEAIVCFGMAESRNQLTLESNATGNNEQLYTSLNLDALLPKLAYSSISHDAGKFVCEGLYYQVLKYLQQSQLQSQGLFVHVPLLTDNNLSRIMTDFRLILKDFLKIKSSNN